MTLSVTLVLVTIRVLKPVQFMINEVHDKPNSVFIVRT